MLDSRSPVATIVLEHSECAPVLARHRIDYCCKGTKPLADACRDLGLDVHRVVAELETVITRRSAAPAIDPRDLTTPAVIAQLIAPHHQYLHRTMPFLQQLAAKVARVHGEHEPKLHDVARIVETLVTTLKAHLGEEEEVLFPALVQGRAANVMPLLIAMRNEHEQVGALLEEMRRAAADYVPPEWACNSYRTLMLELEHLEADTLQHVHLENHVLLPRYVEEA